MSFLSLPSTIFFYLFYFIFCLLNDTTVDQDTINYSLNFQQNVLNLYDWCTPIPTIFPGGSVVKNFSACQCRRHRRYRFDPWVGKIPQKRKWQPTLVFLPRESHEQRSLAGYSPWGCKEWISDWAHMQHTFSTAALLKYKFDHITQSLNWQVYMS